MTPESVVPPNVVSTYIPDEGTTLEALPTQPVRLFGVMLTLCPLPVSRQLVVSSAAASAPRVSSALTARRVSSALAARRVSSALAACEELLKRITGNSFPPPWRDHSHDACQCDPSSNAKIRRKRVT